jgi:spermidine synthase/MFS family permease
MSAVTRDHFPAEEKQAGSLPPANGLPNVSAPRPPSRAIPVLYVGTAFLGAMLGFQIQPVASSAVLPWFGGSPAVWTVCLLFFQSALFFGYFYAFRSIRDFGLRAQLLVHAVLVSAALCMPVLPSSSWKPQGDEFPEWRILWLLAAHVGLPFFVLSATGPLLQVWFLRIFPGKSPYRLYAFSNAGSFVGLVSVPFVLEVWLTLPQQAVIWYAGFVVFAALTLLCAVAALRRGRGPQLEKLPKARESRSTAAREKSRRQTETLSSVRPLWFLLAMTPVVMLAAVTNKLTMDVSPVPFLWILPLTIYLLSLVVCFSSERLAARRFWLPTCGAALLASGILMGLQDNFWVSLSLPVQFAVHLGTLTSVCMVCHGELVRLKPNVRDERGPFDRMLTDFYLVMALGGAAGGMFTAIIAPLIFPHYLEHHLGLLAAALLPLLVLRREERSQPANLRRDRITKLAVAGTVLLTLVLMIDVASTLRSSYVISRSFFGVSRVLERRLPGSRSAYAFELVHGTTRHGFQFVNPELARFPTTYYGPTSGVGIALQSHHANRSRRVGIVGLGVGTLAAYGRPGDRFDFFEIDPVVRDLAANFFRYLADCPAAVEVIPGDARLSLENGRPGLPYDLLVLDAFSSDAVPVHLLTDEAFDVYQSRLADDGIVAVHISNQNFDLRPVLNGHARRRNWSAICIADVGFDPGRMTVPTFWVLMSPQKTSLETPEIAQARTAPMNDALDWTDAHHSLFRILGRPSL